MTHRPGIRLLAIPAAATLSALAGCDPEAPPAAAPLNVESTLGEVGHSPGQFIFPRAVEADAGSLWVIDKAARVQRLDPETGRVLASWTMPEQQLGKPVGITVAPGPAGEPTLYIPDTHYQRIIAYALPDSPAGQPSEIARWGTYGRGPGQFVYPTDVAVLADAASGRAERIYVSEYGGNDRVSCFGPEYQFLFSFGVPGESAMIPLPEPIPGDVPATVPAAGQPEFNRPQSLALDAKRSRLIVTDACNHRLGVFDLDGRLQRWIGSPETVGKGRGCFNYPYGLALADDGSVLVSEVGNHRVQRIDPGTGRCLGLYGTVGRERGELLTPWGVALRGGTAWVLDSGNHRLQSFAAPASHRMAGGAP